MKTNLCKYLLFSLLTALGAFSMQAATPTDAREVNPVEVGATAPNATLRQADGTEVRLHALTADQPAVLVFYRGGWCPYCNRHLSALGEIQAELRDLGYRIHAISPDKPEKVAEAVAETEFDYALYSDASAEAARAFGLAFKVDTKTYEKLQGYGIDLEAASGQEHHLLPVPAVFIIDRETRIRFRYFNPDYKERLSGEQLLDAARKALE
ncbi:MAG: peroxiredoxin-like family protein [Opitutales bacterium]